MTKNRSYTKSGPGRRHDHRPSARTLLSREQFGNKLARKMKRQTLGVRS